MIPEIKNMATRRYYSHNKRSTVLGIKPPKKEDFMLLLHTNYIGGFKCGYCNKKLKIKDNYPYKDVPSIDHKTPLTMGGTNEYDNLIVCCCACNIIKGTLNSDTYKKLLEKIGVESELFNEIFNQSFNGKFANKIDRVKEENGNTN